MAVAGFGRDDLDLTVEDNTVMVTGKAANDTDLGADPGAKRVFFLRHGIAARALQRRFQLADTIKVIEYSHGDGLLTVELVREIPEHALNGRGRQSRWLDAFTPPTSFGE